MVNNSERVLSQRRSKMNSNSGRWESRNALHTWQSERKEKDGVCLITKLQLHLCNIVLYYISPKLNFECVHGEKMYDSTKRRLNANFYRKWIETGPANYWLSRDRHGDTICERKTSQPNRSRKIHDLATILLETVYGLIRSVTRLRKTRNMFVNPTRPTEQRLRLIHGPYWERSLTIPA